MDEKIYLVYEEVSEQYGTSKLVKAFRSKESAEMFQGTLRKRSYIKEIEVSD